jgi:Trk K+ transport system NAD-binding subunit/Kef-type K+ transport system membrane component KefB
MDFTSPQSLLITLSVFFILSMAAKDIGNIFTKLHLPLITGFLFAGILVGPDGLGLISKVQVSSLRFIDEISLAVIALAAGSELYIKELRSRLKSISYVATTVTIFTFLFCTFVVYLMTDHISFTKLLPEAAKISIALLTGAISVARSPSSAIAIVNELRAKGPFTKKILGVTIITDVAVIVIFAITSSAADALLTGLGFNWSTIGILLGEIMVSVGLGYLLGRILANAICARLPSWLKIFALISIGYCAFLMTKTIASYSGHFLAHEFVLEPLLICMVGSFWVTNFHMARDELAKVLHDISPTVYIIFFTLTGASLSLDVFAKFWPIAVALFLVRAASIFVGAYLGGRLAGEPRKQNHISWMAYITQAGIGLGLAKAMADKFPVWGPPLATVIIAAIIINQIIGPALFKIAIIRSGESHTKGDSRIFEGHNDVIIFGDGNQALALAQQLVSHNWSVKIASTHPRSDAIKDNLTFIQISGFTEGEFNKLQMSQAESIVTLLSDEENFQICEIVYEKFGNDRMIVKINDRSNFDKFHEIGALVIEPTTAMISLLDHYVRSPAATSVILGADEDHDIIDIEVHDPDLHHLALRNLRLPDDTVLLSIKRNDHTLISTDSTLLEIGDFVTLMGSPASLTEVSLRFGV